MRIDFQESRNDHEARIVEGRSRSVVLGLIGSGGYAISGSFATTDEKTNTGALAVGAISLAGAYSLTDESALAGAIAAVRTLSGVSILTDELTRLGAVGIGSVAIVGLGAASDEKTQAGALQALFSLLGGFPIRGLYATGAGRCFAVTQNKVFELFVRRALRAALGAVGVPIP